MKTKINFIDLFTAGTSVPLVPSQFSPISKKQYGCHQ